ncbi:hypothetical protein ACP70R_003700 [Stipagrostis hirtigluma subsp. patula]
MDEMKNTNASIESEDVVKPGLSSSRFVKVFMQGEVVGRKINLDVHKNYASLSFTLKRLGNNYSMPSSELNGLVNNEEGGVLDDDNFIIFYDNMDGDRFFLGEVPWELFIISVKRIYIVPVEQENDNDDDEEEEDGENGDGNDATSAAPVDGDDAPANDDGVVDDEDDVVDVSADDGAGEE